MKKYDISRMKQRVEFGSYTSGERNPNTGMAKQVYTPSFSMWCGDYSMTVNQSVNVTGRLVEAERMIVIRHNKQVNDQLLANLDGKLYTIISINSDDDLNAFDVLALKNYRGIKV